MSIHRRADAIRLVAVRLGQGELKDITQKPGIHEALRVSVYYHDGRAPNSVATLMRSLSATCRLQVAYDKTPNPVYFDLTVPSQKYQALLLDLRRTRFDKLDDQPDVPFFGVDLWLVERIAGSFYHDIVLCPSSAESNYREVMLSIRMHIPESVRQGVN
jgi:hypothetical protein